MTMLRILSQFGIIIGITLTLVGCAMMQEKMKSEGAGPDQEEITITPDATYVPQTLAPATAKPVKETIDDQQIASSPLTEPQAPSHINNLLSQGQISPESMTKKPVADNQQDRQFFGEFSGVKTKWEAMKQSLAEELEEQNRKVQELQVKLQLIEQIAQNVDFTTKAYVLNPSHLFAEFTLENHTPYAIKDISITCDQIAPTGTVITSHTETIYDIIKPQTQSSYIPLPYGIKHRQTQSLQCQITNFTVHNASTSQP